MISEAAIDRLQRMFGPPDVSGTRYELRSVLGEGGLGVVYLAYDRALDREVALKVLNQDDPSRVARLEQEARILAKLEHPGIVPVHDVGELPDGRLFYAMKRVRGDQLDRWATAGVGLHARLDVFTRICDAVSFAHAHGIIHRDLKPENVMVGEFGEVLVLDWGLAVLGVGSGLQNLRTQFVEKGDGSHFAGSANAAANDAWWPANGAGKGDGSRFNQGAGTPPYMPPEQANDEAVDERADVYALGTLLLDLADDVAPLTAVAAKARQPDRANRYASVKDLSADVTRFLASEAVTAHRESVFAVVARYGRRHRLPILLVLAYVLMRALLLWAFRI